MTFEDTCRAILKENGVETTMRINSLKANLEDALKAISLAHQEAVRVEYENMVKMIDDYKPDPTAPSFGSASGLMERDSWRQYFIKRIKEELEANNATK